MRQLQLLAPLAVTAELTRPACGAQTLTVPGNLSSQTNSVGVGGKKEKKKKKKKKKNQLLSHLVYLIFIGIRHAVYSILQDI